MSPVSPAEMLTIYGLSLMIIGAMAYHAAGPDAKAMTSIYMGNGGAAVSFLLGVGVRDTTLNKGEPGFIVMMICVHLAFVFPILFGGVVAWRMSLAWNVPAKAYLLPYFGLIIAMSVLTAAVIYARKPKRPKPAEKKDAPEEPATDAADATSSATATVRRRRRAAAM